MATERFTKAEFEAALPTNKNTGDDLWTPVGLEENEYAYLLPVKQGVAIKIRSSVRSDGYAAGTGADSIRAWLVGGKLQPLGSKVISYTTRVTGWQDRMSNVLRELWKRGTQIENCPQCGRPMGIYQVKKDGPNKGRLFMKCWEHGNFRWVDGKGATTAKPSRVFFNSEDYPTDADFWESISGLPSIKARVARIKELLKEQDLILFYGLRFIYNLQTEDEKRAEETYHRNNVGFSGLDAEFLSSLAKQAGDRGLTEKQVPHARRKMMAYAAQIERVLRSTYK